MRWRHFTAGPCRWAFSPLVLGNGEHGGLGVIPAEEHTLATARNAEKVLLAGFTSCVGASAAKPRLDIAVRNEINAGRLPGPRMLAASPEITVTGGLGDERLLHIYREICRSCA